VKIILSEEEFLWAIGGKVENKYTVGDTTVYDVDSNEWYSSENDQLTPMLHPVQGAGWTFFDNKIFVLEGNLSLILDAVITFKYIK